MTREEAESRINDLAWQMRDVLLEYEPNENYFYLSFMLDDSKRLNELSYWNGGSFDGSGRRWLEWHGSIPSFGMERYREEHENEA